LAGLSFWHHDAGRKILIKKGDAMVIWPPFPTRLLPAVSWRLTYISGCRRFIFLEYCEGSLSVEYSGAYLQEVFLSILCQATYLTNLKSEVTETKEKKQRGMSLNFETSFGFYSV